MSPSSSARQRVRAELTGEIVAAARSRLAADGAAGLSLRAVARDLGLVPSALYRYFDSRDALITRLITDAYAALGDAAEAADPGAGRYTERLLAVAAAIRGWGLAHPHDWALLYGSPIPGYEAPADTIGPAVRVATAVALPIADAYREGAFTAPPVGPAPAAAVGAALAPIEEALLPGAPPALVAWGVLAYTLVLGTTSLELFGHFKNGVLDVGAVLDQQVRAVAAAIGLEAR